MVARHYYRNDDGDLELVPTVLRWGWTLKEAAEEGEAPIVTVTVDDPTMSLDFVGHRRWIVREDESEDDNDVIYSGFVQTQTIAHKGGDITNPLGRVWTVELIDMNTLWTNRILVGSDVDRPEETDVERMTWLVGTEEMGYFDDISLISASGAVDMDEDDTRGRTTGSVADSCAQQSGKNWWIGARDTGIFVWYGKDSYTGYDSPLALSNDPADLDMAAVDAGTATVYPLGADTELGRDPQRIYSGAYVEYQNGAVYVKDTGTMEMFSLSGRDIASPAPELRTATKAKARGRRILADSDSQELVLSTTVVIPASKVSQIRTGMRIPIVMTHGTDGFATGLLCRILNAAPSPISNGSWYTVAIEAIPVGVTAPSCSAALALSATASNAGLESGGSTATDTMSISGDGYAVALLLAFNDNTPNAENMGNPAGYTVLDNQADFSRSTWSLSYKAVSAGSTTATATFTPGFGSVGCWIAAQAWFPWSSFAVVQEKGPVPNTSTATFDAPVTPGNTVLMLAVTGGTGTITPTGSDWTELFSIVGTSNNIQAGLWARCVAEGDGDTYSYGVLNVNLQQNGCYIVEVAT